MANVRTRDLGRWQLTIGTMDLIHLSTKDSDFFVIGQLPSMVQHNVGDRRD
ncbi:hypothetical protein BH23BAC3_BH23BAC3_19290 [soil metagenome]